MRTSLKERIFSALFVGVLLFMVECVMYKLFLDRSNWLAHSAIWSTAWAVGHFVGKTMTNLEERLWKIVLFELLIVFLVFILLAFIFGVICNMASWLDLVSTITVSFGVSTIINNKWIRD